MKMRYRTGDVLFREGDPSDFACLILDGAVTVQRSCDGEIVQLGTVGAGDLVGEMGVLEGQPRSATIVAANDLAVELIGADKLMDWICATPENARRVLGRLSSRVRSMSEQIVVLHATLHSAGIIPPDIGDATRHGQAALASGDADDGNPDLQPLSARKRVTLRCTGAAGNAVVEVTRLPFRIGRRAPELGLGCGDDLTLLVEDIFPYRVSIRHFMIDCDPDLGWFVRDLGSDLGTTVNGQFLGGIFAKDTLRLHDGLNTIVAGGIDSPYVFKLTLEEA